MSLRSLIKVALNRTVKNVSTFFRGIPASEIAATNPVVKPYNRREHSNFHVVSSAVVLCFLDDRSPKTAKQLAVITGYAESTIRAVCKLLAEDGTLVRVQDFPASYQLPG